MHLHRAWDGIHLVWVGLNDKLFCFKASELIHFRVNHFIRLLSVNLQQNKNAQTMGFNTSSIWIKVALICLLLGTLLFVIGFATNVWMTTDGYRYANYGLWRVESCDRVSCSSFKITHDWLVLNRMDGKLFFAALSRNHFCEQTISGIRPHP